MDLTDARTRKKVTLNPRTVLSNSCVLPFIQLNSPIHIGITSQGIGTRRHRYRIFKCPARRLRLDHQGMAFITERRRVLGSYARPRVWCPRFGHERGGLGRCVEGVGGCIVGEGTHFGFFRSFFVLLNGCDGHMILKKKKWSVLAMGSVAHFLQQGSLLVALSQLSATRYVHRSPPPPSNVFLSRSRGLFPDYLFPIVDSAASFWFRSSRWRGGRHCPVLLS
jgi:hypothetical protein